MKRSALSLRLRLLFVMLAPLFCISIALGAWRVIETNQLAEDLFDRTLLSVALSIAKDVEIRDGEALSPDTVQLLTETSGGRIFYHVKGPDGSFVTGYATPPLNPEADTPKLVALMPNEADIYSGIYRGNAVRVVQLNEPVDLGWIEGDFVVSVWQNLSARQSFAWDIVKQTIIVLALLLTTVLVVTWFGLRFALRPLTNLEAAIAKRGANELRPIMRSVPQEVEGIVSTLNHLLDRISRRISSKDQFLSNAAHQLRTPIAGVLSLSQSLQAETGPESKKERVTALVTASKHLSRLSNQLLSFERNRELGKLSVNAEVHDLNVLAAEVIERSAPALLREGFEVSFERGPVAPIRCEPILVQEVLQNLLDNAAKHGGRPDLGIMVSVSSDAAGFILRVMDTGIGLKPSDSVLAFSRFSQVQPGVGSGLGLSIAQIICSNHGGTLQIEDDARGTSIAAIFPKALAEKPIW